MSRLHPFLYLLAINGLLLIFLILMVEVFSFLFMKSLPVMSGWRIGGISELEIDGRVLSPIYENKEQARAFYREWACLKTVYDPYIPWALEPMQGQAINISNDRKRRTCNNSPGKEKGKTFRIFMFGGSTLFGTGVEDCATIPSLLAAKIKTTHPQLRFEITNFGASALQSTQELIQLQKELQMGSRPNLVLFYDGVNDIYASVYSPGIPGAHQNLEEIANRFNDSRLSGMWHRSETARLIRYVKERFSRGENKKEEELPHEKIRKALEVYATNIEILQLLAKKFQFEFRAFWQPVLLDGTKTPTPFEKGIVEKSGVLNQIYKSSYDRFRKVKSKGLNIRDLSFSFEDEMKDIFLDFCHLGYKGNQIIAHSIFNEIKDHLKHLSEDFPTLTYE